MPAVAISHADLTVFAADLEAAKAEAMIVDAMAMAKLVAPCIGDTDLDEGKAAAAKAIIRGAILRWHEAGQGGRSQHVQTIGPFSESQTFDTRQRRRSMFWPSEIEQLQDICKKPEDEGGGAWGYDTLGAAAVVHADDCSLMFGAQFCSCGAAIAGHPLYGAGADGQ